MNRSQPSPEPAGGARLRPAPLGAPLAALLAGLAPAGGQTTRPAPGWAAPRAVCTLDDRRIAEASGIAASRRNPGLYYVHNDSGDAPRVFLIDRRGRTRLTIHLDQARNVDWEDLAIAPGARPGTFDVCVADIGDNLWRRPELVIYRFPEVEPGAGRGGVLQVPATACRIAYADGPRDAEAFVVHPRSGDGYVLTKRLDGACRVYRLPAPWDCRRRVVLAPVATLRPPGRIPLEAMVTAADIAPDGRRLVTRSYLCGWEWDLGPRAAAADFEPIFRTRPARLELAAEPQGEAICYSADGRALLTVSERLPAVLYESRLRAQR